MKTSQQFKLAAAAAAVAGVFAGHAANAQVHGAGASAVNNSLKGLLLNEYCTPGTIQYFDNDAAAKAGGSTYRIVCSPANTTKFAAGVDVSYDTQGGSYKALTATSPAIFTANQAATGAYPVNSVDNNAGVTGSASTCTTFTTNFSLKVPAGTFTVDYYAACPVFAVSTTDSVSFGLTDVEGAMFLSAINQPVKNNTWVSPSNPYLAANLLVTAANWSLGTEPTGFPKQVFGVVFGIGASGALYSAMQTDQIARGLIPATFTNASGTVVNCQGTVNETCAPYISRSQYRSLVAESTDFGDFDGSLLFAQIKPAAIVPIEVARRDMGSGTQASSNQYFLNVGCTSKATEASNLTPAVPKDSSTNYKVTWNATTGAVIKELDQTGVYVIGVVSAENDTGGEIKSTTAGHGVGFLKLDGFYPKNSNAANGLYNYYTEETLHCNPLASGDDLTLCNDLAGSGTSVLSMLTYANTGIVTIGAPVGTAATTTYTSAAPLANLASGATTYYHTNGNSCTGSRTF